MYPEILELTKELINGERRKIVCWQRITKLFNISTTSKSFTIPAEGTNTILAWKCKEL